MYSPWHKVYKLLLDFYFKSNKMIVKLIHVSDTTATYIILRNGKVLTTRLNDFVKAFSIINYKVKS
jgi:hypothetical protein